MFLSSPQFFYIVLILPGIFGLVLIGDGINQIVNEEMSGFIAIFFGIIFVIAVVVAYFIFSNFH